MRAAPPPRICASGCSGKDYRVGERRMHLKLPGEAKHSDAGLQRDGKWCIVHGTERDEVAVSGRKSDHYVLVWICA